jgi:hypothetical protein
MEERKKERKKVHHSLYSIPENEAILPPLSLSGHKPIFRG